MDKKKKVFALAALSLLLAGCGNNENVKNAGLEEAQNAQSIQSSQLIDAVSESGASEEKEQETMSIEMMEELFSNQKNADFYKGILDTNPIMTQRFGADPYAMVYGDTVYFYMTADTLEYDANGEVKENSFRPINTINVVSTKDMINFTDHGEIPVAGANGAAKWANNSWAPAAAWKNIDGQDRFFLYFADGGGGIGVLTSDSPVGPFVDPIGHGLITRNTPTCDKVLWLFDPAVLVDEDGTGYIYFGGGVPEGKAPAPGTGRAAKLGADMISLDGDPVPTDVPYLFEDSGIHKYKDKYYYTYCTNFSVDKDGTAKYGFTNGEIACLVSDNPLGPFTYQERILKNPGSVYGLSGNNHHCVFNFKDQWYITYHTRVLEKKIGIEHSYRCTHVTPFAMNEDGTIGLISMSLQDREAVAGLSALEEQNATTCTLVAGMTTADAGIEGEIGTWCLSGIHSGAFVRVAGVNFGESGVKTLTLKLRDAKQGTGKNGNSVTVVPSGEDTQAPAIKVCTGSLKGKALAYVDVNAASLSEKQGFVEVQVDLLQEISGTEDLYFVFSGTGYEVLSWQFQ